MSRMMTYRPCLPVALGLFALPAVSVIPAQTPMAPPAVGSVTAPQRVDTKPFYQAPSTRRMAERLQSIYAATDFALDSNKASGRVTYYTHLLASRPLSLPDQTTVRLQLAKEMLSAGDPDSAIRTLEDLRQRWSAANQTVPPAIARELGRWLATAYLRLGEQENCAGMHGGHACLFPLRRDAAHTLPRGAQGAVRELSALLAASPSDAESQWLLNVAYMQLGRYPQDVPPRWLIPDSRFRSEAALPEFAEIAASAGVDITGHAGGALVEDFDGDGRLDIMISSSGPLDQMHLFHNNGDGTFTDVTRSSGLLGETGGLNLVLTDYNNDGHPDVLVLRGGWWGRQGLYPMSLLRNNGDGTFDDVTEQAGLLSFHPTQTAAWADFDRDGWLDLFVGHESGPGNAKEDQHPSQLFHNNRDGTFTEIAAPSGLANLGFVKGVAWGDIDNDGWPDLYVSVMYGKNRLFRNDGIPGKNGSWRFTDVTARAGVDKQDNSFACWFFDYDNDGWPDLFVGGYATESKDDVGNFEMGRPSKAGLPRLYRNLGSGSFQDVTADTHLDRAILPMGASFGDLDNDGWLDIYLGTGDSLYQSLLPNRMFRNAGGRAFEDVTTAGDFGHLQKGHAVAFADLRGTGFEDIFEEMGGALPGDTYQSALYRNPGNANHSVTLILEGVKSNRPAVGARIDLAVQTSTHGTRHIFRTVGYGSSFGGNPFRQHVGLGPATHIQDVTIRWPSGIVDHHANLKADQTYRIPEGGQPQLQLLR